jgi:hypothetical protein
VQACEVRTDPYMLRIRHAIRELTERSVD